MVRVPSALLAKKTGEKDGPMVVERIKIDSTENASANRNASDSFRL